jgi:hypothetical protein
MRSHHECTCGSCYSCRSRYGKCAGKGTTALGIVGTVLGGAALLGEGVLGGRGLFGRDGKRDGYGYEGYGRGEYGPRGHMLDKCSCLVDKFELAQSEKIARLESIVEKERAEKFAIERDERILCAIDEKHDRACHKSDNANEIAVAALEEVKCLKNIIQVTEGKNAEIAALKDKIVEEKLEKELTKLKGKVDLNKADADCCCEKTNIRIDCLDKDFAGAIAGVKHEIRSAIALEAERRQCADGELDYKIRDEREDRMTGDKEIYAFCDCNFIKAKKYIPRSEVGKVVCGCDDDDCGRRDRNNRRRRGIDDNDGNIIIRGNSNTVTPTVTNTPTLSGPDESITED